jgi:hypothetical protein
LWWASLEFLNKSGSPACGLSDLRENLEHRNIRVIETEEFRCTSARFMIYASKYIGSMCFMILNGLWWLGIGGRKLSVRKCTDLRSDHRPRFSTNQNLRRTRLLVEFVRLLIWSCNVLPPIGITNDHGALGASAGPPIAVPARI